MAENRYEGVSEAGLEAILDVPGLESALLQLIRKLTQDLHKAVNRDREDLDELFRDVDKLFQDFHEAVNRNREDLERFIRGWSERERKDFTPIPGKAPPPSLPPLGISGGKALVDGNLPDPKIGPEPGVKNTSPNL